MGDSRPDAILDSVKAHNSNDGKWSPKGLVRTHPSLSSVTRLQSDDGFFSEEKTRNKFTGMRLNSSSSSSASLSSDDDGFTERKSRTLFTSTLPSANASARLSSYDGGLSKREALTEFPNLNSSSFANFNSDDRGLSNRKAHTGFTPTHLSSFESLSSRDERLSERKAHNGFTPTHISSNSFASLKSDNGGPYEGKPHSGLIQSELSWRISTRHNYDDGKRSERSKYATLTKINSNSNSPARLNADDAGLLESKPRKTFTRVHSSSSSLSSNEDGSLGSKTGNGFTPAQPISCPVTRSNLDDSEWSVRGTHTEYTLACPQVPSMFTETVWLWLDSPLRKSLGTVETNKHGKWMLFLNKISRDRKGLTSLDRTWFIVANLVEENIVFSAKCSTAAEFPYKVNRDIGVITLYTTDYNNKADLKRVAERVQLATGYGSPMYYKTYEKKQADAYVYFGKKNISSFRYYDRKLYEKIGQKWKEVEEE